MKTFLGIDGGGTKTGFLLADESGRILAEAKTGTTHYQQIGTEGIPGILREGLDAVFSLSGTTASDLAGVFFGCPGYGDTPANEAPIREAAAKAFGDIPFAIGNDSENALAGALAGEPGICLIMGTGSMGLGVNKDGKRLRCGGWHHAIGSDEGSGYWISIKMLTAFTRQSDGRDEKTPLYDAIREALELEYDGDVITRVVDEWQTDRTKVASLTRLIPDLLEKDDPVVRSILSAAAGELAEIARTLYRQLGFTGEVRASCVGGVTNLGDAVLSPLAARLKEDSMILTPPVYGPDKGALIRAYLDAGFPIPEGFLI